MIGYDIQNLVKWYAGQERPANNDITLQIEQGEIFGILGENGAGKSTLVRHTLIGPVTGELLIDLAVIIACTIVTFWLAAGKIDWRQR